MTRSERNGAMGIGPRLMGAPFAEYRQMLEPLGLRVLHQIEFRWVRRAIVKRTVLISSVASDPDDLRLDALRFPIHTAPEQFLFSNDCGPGQVERFENTAMQPVERADKPVMHPVIYQDNDCNVSGMI